MRIKIGSVEFSNPVMTASGTFGYGIEVPELVDVTLLGAIVTKSITLHPREGNPPPRMVETPSGMLNSIGLANLGVNRFIKEMLPAYETIGTRVIINIAGTTQDEYAETLERIESVSSNIVGYEVNISCPNVDKGGLKFGVDCDLTSALIERLRPLTERLLIVKLTPNVTDISAIGKSAEDAGADAVSAINTVLGMSIDISSRKPHIHGGTGGLSGPAIKPVGIAAVYRLYQSLSIPVIGIGGIVNGQDALEYMLAGALAIQVGSGNFRNPGIGGEIVDELRQYGEENDLASISNLTGTLGTH